MNRFIPRKINLIEEYIPQSDDAEIILDANESPFPASDSLLKEITAIAENMKFTRYPDSLASEPVREFAKVYGINESCVVMGNGSDELISVIETGFLTSEDKIVVVVPDFSMYSFYGSIAGAEVIKYVKSGDFGIDFDELGRLCDESKAKIVIFSNPCNPTSRAYMRDEILKFTDSHELIVIADEAYMEFCRDGCSVLYDTEKRENLIVLKTLSKAFGMAAIRAGFAVTNADIASAIKKIKSPYNTSTFTQKTAAAVLRRFDEMKSNAEVIIKNRNKLYTELVEIAKNQHFEVYPSDTNFILVKAGDRSREIYENLLKKKIRIRFMGEYLRITAGSESECEALIAALVSQRGGVS